MVIEWREREHVVAYQDALDDPRAIQSLCQCDLLKFFAISTMQTKRELLELLIGHWDLDSASFLVVDQRVSFPLDDVYFMTNLSCQGEVVNLHGGGHLEGYLFV